MEYQNNMWFKKNGCRNEIIKIEQLIDLIENSSNTNIQINQTIFREIIATFNLNEYFHDLHKCLAIHNLFNAKRYENISDGIYILLRGQVSFMFKDDRIQNNAAVNTSNKINSGTTIISLPCSIFQCKDKNCHVLEDSIFFKITEEQANCCKFYELKNKREQLYQNHFLSMDHLSIHPFKQLRNVFTADIKIHSNFYFKSFLFRNEICLSNVGIVSKGRAKLKKSKEKFLQFDKYGLLLPNLTYQVTSSDLEILVIKINQSLIFKEDIPVVYNQNIEYYEKNKCKQINFLYPNQKGTFPKELFFTKKQKQKHNKQIMKISKESENYTIISTYLCQKSLDYAKKQNHQNQYKQKRQLRYKNPLILFNYINTKSKTTLPNFTESSTIDQSTPNAKKSVSYKNENSQLNNYSILLKKIKVQSDYYDKIIKNQSLHKKEQKRSEITKKTMASLSQKKNTFDFSNTNIDKFVRYEQLQ